MFRTRFAVMALTLMTSAASAQEGGRQAMDTAKAGRTIQVPWHLYQHYPADFSAWSRAARGFRGWTS